ncbi:hypothetical protein DY000_02016917 [Brassica cretica]|uniref:Uncharacterized protein n=1 Tax=Brassica cretica TaxID=69181 RepID=A0ABQ7CU60_BRACR|nr:hypothetical protein DY000_02016917 [Brassica cretica]
MHVLLKSGQSALREEAVEEMKDCRSMKQPCHRSTEWLSRGLREISLDENAWIRVISTFGRVRSLCSDRVSSDRAWLELGRYVANEPCSCSVATQQTSLARARSLPSD